VPAPLDATDWVDVTHGPLPLDEIQRWATRPECGAVVTFTGTARDHAPGRSGVTELEYEGYERFLVPRLEAVVDEARNRWPDLTTACLIHRLGVVEVGEAAVVVAAGSAHRSTAFEAARFCIDTAKATVPIWKRETWDSGTDWGLDGCFIGEAADTPRPDSVPASAVAAASASHSHAGPDHGGPDHGGPDHAGPDHGGQQSDVTAQGSRPDGSALSTEDGEVQRGT